MRRLALALAVLLLPAGADAEEQAVGPATCPAERAIYELRAPDTQEGVAPRLRAGLATWPASPPTSI